MKTKLVIFGMTGHLAQHKLLPALGDIIKAGQHDDVSIVGVSRREITAAEIVGNVPELKDRTSVFTMDLTLVNDYRKLRDFLALESDEQALFYLSVPPSAAADIVELLGQAGLDTPNVKILFEKPFGFDLESAKDFLERTEYYFNENQIYRIDHYMAKEVTQYILKLRGKAQNQHGWDFNTIKSIDVIASETADVKGREVFYEQTGALRDFIQGHLMQLLSLVLMEVGEDFSLDQLAKHRLKALKALEPADPTKARRAQYDGYQDDVSNPGSLTETFVSLSLQSNDPRWQGVPLRLITGRTLSEKRSYVEVAYRDGTVDTFEEGKTPIEGRLKDAYERVIEEAIAGRKTIFTTGPEVLRSWEIVAPVQKAWEMDNQPLATYAQGSTLNDLLS